MRFFVMKDFDYEGDLDVEEFVDDRIIRLAESELDYDDLDAASYLRFNC